jgi:single-strand DNA-binding protein
MSDYNKITFIGNLGSDPDLRFTPQGKAVASFNVACNQTYKRDGEKVKDTTWFRVSCFGAQAENVKQYLHKGDQVHVEGRLTPDKDTGSPHIWNGSDGTPKASYEVIAFDVQFLKTKSALEKQQPIEEDMPF